MLVAIHDEQVGLDIDGSRGRRIEAEERRVALPPAQARRGSRADRARRRPPAVRRGLFAPGATTIVVSPSASTVISATPVGSANAATRARPRLPAAQPSPPPRPDPVRLRDHPHLGAHSRGGDGLIRSLPARVSRERRAGDRLAGTRQPLGARDEIEVDRPDGQLRRQARAGLRACRRAGSRAGRRARPRATSDPAPSPSAPPS